MSPPSSSKPGFCRTRRTGACCTRAPTSGASRGASPRALPPSSRTSGLGNAAAASTVVSAPSNSSRSSTTARDSSRRARSSPARGSGPSTGSAAGRRRSFRHSAASPTAIPPVRNAARRFTGWTISRGRTFGARAGRSGARRRDPDAPDRASGRARSWGRPSLDRCYYGRRFLAYEIDHKADGAYHLLTFTAETETLEEISRVLKITDGVMRHLAVRRSERRPAQTVAASAPARQDGAEAATVASEEE